MHDRRVTAQVVDPEMRDGLIHTSAQTADDLINTKAGGADQTTLTPLIL